MKKAIVFSVILFFFLSFIHISNAASISVNPDTVIQGEPFMVSIEGVNDTSNIKVVIFDGSSRGVFIYQDKPSALVGVDLYKKPGSYMLSVIMNDGTFLEKKIFVGARQKIVAPLGIPAKLGGNTAVNQTAVVNTLALENKMLNNLFTGKKAFWNKKFQYPIINPIVTDQYGYTRLTGQYNIAHKGADFRAKEGTNIHSMNRGVVRVARETTVYGKTIVVDHGLGLMTFYMHLSKIYVNEGELVQRGQVIGKSGSTGYAESPHLHLSVRVNNTSIDPVKFMQLWN